MSASEKSLPQRYIPVDTVHMFRHIGDINGDEVMTDLTHLTALQTRLRHEREYLAAATSEQEVALRTVWIAQIEREISGEYAFLGIEPVVECDMTDEELLAALAA